MTDAKLREGTVSAQDAIHDETVPLAKDLLSRDLVPQYGSTLAIDVKTNDEDLNARNPTVKLIPFTGRDEREGGLLNVLTIEHENERVPAARFAVTSKPTAQSTSVIDPSEDGDLSRRRRVGQRRRSDAEDSQTGNIAGQSAEEAELEFIGIEDGSPSVMSKERVAMGEVSIQASIPCYTCATIVTGICSYALNKGTVSIPVCIKVCTPLVTTVVGGIACVGVCAIIVEAIVAVGCTAAGGEICKRTPFC